MCISAEVLIGACYGKKMGYTIKRLFLLPHEYFVPLYLHTLMKLNGSENLLKKSFLILKKYNMRILSESECQFKAKIFDTAVLTVWLSGSAYISAV